METARSLTERVLTIAETARRNQAQSFRFEIFKGVADNAGRVQKIRPVGTAQIRAGSHTAHLFINALDGQRYFLLPEKKRVHDYDFVILTREPSQQPGRKYFWKPVGDGQVLSGLNRDLIRLSWDLFGADDIYMTLMSSDGTDLRSVSEMPSEVEGF